MSDNTAVTPAPAPENKSSQLKVLTVLGMAQVTSALYIIMQASIKDTQNRFGVSVAEISFARAFCCFFFSLICLFIYRQNPLTTVKRDLVIPLIIRCVMGTMTFFLVTKAVTLLPLTIFQVVTNISPFIAGLIARVWLGEKLSYFQLICMVLCFGGIAIVTLSKSSDSED